MSQPVCIRCLLFVQHCECSQGPRLQRHPASCQCSMCEQGRAIVSGSTAALSSVDDDSADGAEE